MEVVEADLESKKCHRTSRIVEVRYPADYVQRQPKWSSSGLGFLSSPNVNKKDDPGLSYTNERLGLYFTLEWLWLYESEAAEYREGEVESG